MPKPFDFLNDPSLPPHLAARAQAIADKRAAAGLISADGVTHRTTAAKALYDAGASSHSREYRSAAFN